MAKEPKKQKVKPKKVVKDDPLKNTQFFYRPVLVESLFKLTLSEEEEKFES